MHIVLVRVAIKPEMLERFEEALLHNARESVRKDPGCRRFDVSQAKEDPLTWVLHEVYDDEAAHAAHRQAPHFLTYQAVASEAIVDKTVLWCHGRHIT
jgi:quinol monooxygenase YgiN